MKKRYRFLFLFIAFGFILINSTLSEVKSLPKITIKSQMLDYDKKDEGSFKVEKSAKWVGEGKAKITIEVNSIMKESSQAKDIIFVLDASGSMRGNKLNQVKKDTIDLVKAVLSNPRNRVALITFDSGAEKQSGFTSNKDEFIKKVNNLSVRGATNYKEGLEEAKKLLEGYKREKGKDLVLLFLTDGFPNKGDPNEEAVYKELKQKYPYININAIQYEMGEAIKPEIKAISERQFSADMKSLNNVLFEAVATPSIYDHFVITDYISKHFKGKATKIKASQGDFKLEGDQVTWNLGTYRSGTKATLEIEVDQVGSIEEFYKTNKGIDIKTSLENHKDDQKSSETPALKGLYKVIYEANAPKGCTVKNLEETKLYKLYDSVLISKEEPTCEGYIFQGYELMNDVRHINDDYIMMPEEDIVLRATWSKLSIKKSMQGEVSDEGSLYRTIKDQSLGNDKDKAIDYNSNISETNGNGVYLLDESKEDKNPVYFYRGTHDLNNNIIYGGFCWKIIRTTDTGGVRLIYNGLVDNGKCPLTLIKNETTKEGQKYTDEELSIKTSIGLNMFNSSELIPQSIGYMYGKEATPYDNTYNSTVKDKIDEWYKTNIKDKNLDNLIDKAAIYCGDRRIQKADDYFDNFMSKVRFDAGTPSVKCPLNDSYAVEGGNKKLTYPVALISVDEAMLGGLYPDASYNDSKRSYLQTDRSYWTLSPSMVNDSWAGVYYVSTPGLDDYMGPNGTADVRPVITIIGTTFLKSGTGSKDNPYII